MGLLDVFRRTPRRRPGAGDGAPPEPVLPVEAQVRAAEEVAVELISAGFVGRLDAEDHLVDAVADDRVSYPDLDERRARQVVAQVWRERLAIESTWSDEGDYPALREAFEDLERSGIVARMSFTCCQSCGHAEIGDEVDDQIWGATAPAPHGYTFFHAQDAGRLAPSGSDLYLAFGSFSPDAEPEDEALVGGEVAAALGAHGLVVDWDGSPGSRVRVTRLDWRKRLPLT